MGHRDFKTTLIYADYQPGAEEAALVERAFSGSRTLSQADLRDEPGLPDQSEPQG
jgi:hypothetical protein